MACAALFPATSALATPPTFTSGYFDPIDDSGDNIYSGMTFHCTVTGPANTTWTIYSLPEGNYESDPQIIGTVHIDSDGNGHFDDPNAGSYDWSSQFYQLTNGADSSAIFGYVVEPIDGEVYGDVEEDAAVENWLIPLDPGTANSVLTSTVFWDYEGNSYPLSADQFFDDSTDDNDHEWLDVDDGWDSGNSISFGNGDTLWLSDFPVSEVEYEGNSSSLVTIIGFHP